MLYKYASSLSQVGLIEIKAACDEVGHGDEVASGAITAGLGLCGLDETVDAFENAVGDVGCEPAETPSK
jgi:hypothetical protein